MADTRHAVFSKGSHGWQMFVVLTGSLDDWPSHQFGTDAIPTVDARTAVLKSWGYEITPGAEWAWSEDTAPDGSVVLLAGTEVQRTK